MPTQPRPNVVLICVDQMRGDCLSIDDHPIVHTPYLDQLALSGTRFTNAYTACPSCIAARADSRVAPQELRQVLGETGWHVERLYPSDLLAAMVGEERLRQGLESPEGMSQAIEMEERFREEPSLVGSGMELLFVATKRPMGQR